MPGFGRFKLTECATGATRNQCRTRRLGAPARGPRRFGRARVKAEGSQAASRLRRQRAASSKQRRTALGQINEAGTTLV